MILMGKLSDFDLLIFYKPTSSEVLMKIVEKSRQLEIPSLIISGSEINLRLLKIFF
jgi:hypothetical protein